MSATNRGCERKAYDFYATPPETVQAFLANFDGISSGDRILEPSAGNGQIVKVLREGGYDNRIDAVELRPEERAPWKLWLTTSQSAASSTTSPTAATMSS